MTQPHYAAGCLITYDGHALKCACGHLAYGTTWEEAGAEMDGHLSEVAAQHPPEGT